MVEIQVQMHRKQLTNDSRHFHSQLFQYKKSRVQCTQKKKSAVSFLKLKPFLYVVFNQPWTRKNSFRSVLNKFMQDFKSRYKSSFCTKSKEPKLQTSVPNVGKHIFTLMTCFDQQRLNGKNTTKLPRAEPN